MGEEKYNFAAKTQYGLNICNSSITREEGPPKRPIDIYREKQQGIKQL